MAKNSLRIRQRPSHRACATTRWLLPALLLLAACGGELVKPARNVAGTEIPDPLSRAELRFAGNGQSGPEPQRQAQGLASKTIPDSPNQGKPWTPPATKLPRSLVDATAALFELGAADPRGCDYREVEVDDASAVQKVRGFVMPERPGVAGRFVVGWDGLVRPALTVGAKADLDSDVQALAIVLKKSRESPQFLEYRTTNATGTTTEHRDPISPFFEIRWPPTTVPRSPLTLCMLLRMGRADLAESLYAAATTWTPVNARPDVADEMVSFPSLSRGWAETLYLRLIAAHCGADDVVALDAARRLDRFRQAVAAKPGLVDAPANAAFNRGILQPAYVRNADVLRELLADQERRAKEAPRGPVPPRGGDPAARIAALIRDFDQIHVQQRLHFGGAEPGDGAIVNEIVAEGDPAVGPLLAALESDTRLTRCISGRWGHDEARRVFRAAYAALRRILKSESFMDSMSSDFIALETADGRKRLAQAARAFWEKNAAVPIVERWYRTLRDDSAGPARWIEAASGLLQTPGRAGSVIRYTTVRRPGQPKPGALRGEPLRKLRNPSISELLARRCEELKGTSNSLTFPDTKLIGACDLALRFTWWDEVGSLPTIKALMTTCRERSLDPQQGMQSGVYAGYFFQFTIVCMQAGDREALDDYAAWLQEIEPETIETSWREVLEPLWNYPDHKALSQAARAMFLDPESHWLPLVHIDEGRRGHQYQHALGSPLVCLPAFREALLGALAVKAKMGTAMRQPRGGLHYTLAAGGSGSTSDVRLPDPAEKPGVEVPFRACDYVAWQISGLDGAPECALTWPEARRDAAIVACAAYLRRFGPRFAAEYVQGVANTRNLVAQLHFPALAHPATPDDVREGRAVFSLTEEGETRTVPLPSSYPVPARWLALKSFPIIRRSNADPPDGNFLQDGRVWQAEEVKKGDRWERYFGFVGHATIARVPASEIEFSPDSNGRLDLANGLAARLATADPSVAVFRPGEPVPVMLRLYNVRGIEQSAPTEFIRAGADGKQALRRGVSLVLDGRLKDSDGQGLLHAVFPPPGNPTRTDQFDPGNASRTLAPSESLEAMRLNLNDWYAGLKPGWYMLQVKFGTDSGIGEGTTNQLQFWIVEPDQNGQ